MENNLCNCKAAKEIKEMLFLGMDERLLNPQRDELSNKFRNPAVHNLLSLKHNGVKTL